MKATTEATSGDGAWQQVRRRRPYPPNWRHSQPSPPRNNLYQPYSRPTYAEILRKPPTAPTMKHTNTTPPSTQPSSPASPKETVYYVSPHSPSRLRFPPSHTFSEWKGRCFRCCRTGHSAAKCRNPKRCGKCWAFGHIGTNCKQEMIVPPMHPIKDAKPKKPVRGEPGFEELLTGSYPYIEPHMPSERPLRLHCFIERDEEYFTELQRLSQGVVMHTRGFQWDISVDNVVSYACRTNLVKREEIQVSQLSGSRFLIILPEGLDPDTFINATPQEAWDEGLSFQPWTPLEGAEISVPAYKVLLRLVGIPAHLWREKHILNAVSRFGVYLGSVAPENPASLASWIVARGVDDLTLVPTQLAMHDCGMVHPIQVFTLAYHRGPIYSVDEMPKHPKTYTRPQPTSYSSASSDDEPIQDNMELVPMSSRVIRELCRGRTADSLPPEVRRFATLEEMDMAHPELVTHTTVTKDQPNPLQYFQPTQSSAINSSNNILGNNILITNVAGPSERASGSPHEFNRSFANRRSVSPDKAMRNSINLQISPHILRRTNPEPSRIPTLPKPTLSNSRRIQPQKILTRGDSFGNKFPPARITTDREILGHNQRHISSTVGGNPDLIDNVRKGVRDKISNNDPPSGLEITNGGHVPSKDHPGFQFKAKSKGPILNQPGPYNTKYKWVRPIKQIPANNAQNTKKVIASSSHKRKNVQPQIAHPSKKKTTKGKEQKGAEVSFNSEGFYEVRVDYQHISNLAMGCGFKNKDIEEVIQADNAQRQLQSQIASTSAAGTVNIEEEDHNLSRFELDSDDELSSDEEAC